VINRWLSEADRGAVVPYSWRARVPSTWLLPQGELADGIDTVGCASSDTEHDLAVLPGREPKEGGRLQVRTGSGAKPRTPMESAGERSQGSHYAPGRQMCLLIRAYKADLHTLSKNSIIDVIMHLYLTCLQPVWITIWRHPSLSRQGTTPWMHLYVVPG